MTIKEKYQQYEERIANLASANQDLMNQVNQLEEMIKLSERVSFKGI